MPFDFSGMPRQEKIKLLLGLREKIDRHMATEPIKEFTRSDRLQQPNDLQTYESILRGHELMSERKAEVQSQIPSFEAPSELRPGTALASQPTMNLNLGPLGAHAINIKALQAGAEGVQRGITMGKIPGVQPDPAATASRSRAGRGVCGRTGAYQPDSTRPTDREGGR